MAKHTHTPGPWEALLGDAEGHGKYSINTTKKEDLIYVAETIGGLGDETEGANARLIAAAPQLLEALENYVMTIAVGGGNDRHEFMAKIREADNAARAAIKAARGRK